MHIYRNGAETVPTLHHQHIKLKFVLSKLTPNNVVCWSYKYINVMEVLMFRVIKWE